MADEKKSGYWGVLLNAIIVAVIGTVVAIIINNCNDARNFCSVKREDRNFENIHVEVDEYDTKRFKITFPDCEQYKFTLSDKARGPFKIGADITSDDKSIVAIRHGHRKDLHQLITHHDGKLITRNFRVQDGANHDIEFYRNQYYITYGNNRDLKRVIEFCNGAFQITHCRREGREFELRVPVCSPSNKSKTPDGKFCDDVENRRSPIGGTIKSSLQVDQILPNNKCCLFK